MGCRCYQMEGADFCACDYEKEAKEDMAKIEAVEVPLMPNLFGKDIDEMTDAEVALTLASAAYDRITDELEAAQKRYDAAEQRLLEAQADREEEFVASTSVLSGASQSWSGNAEESSGDFFFTQPDVQIRWNDGEDVRQFSLLNLIDENGDTTAHILIQKFGTDRDWFTVQPVNEEMIDVLQYLGLL